MKTKLFVTVFLFFVVSAYATALASDSIELDSLGPPTGDLETVMSVFRVNFERSPRIATKVLLEHLLHSIQKAMWEEPRFLRISDGAKDGELREKEGLFNTLQRRNPSPALFEKLMTLYVQVESGRFPTNKDPISALWRILLTPCQRSLAG